MLTPTGKCQIERPPGRNQRKAKTIFQTPEAAREAARQNGLRIYRCESCRFWHITGKYLKKLDNS